MNTLILRRSSSRAQVQIIRYYVDVWDQWGLEPSLILEIRMGRCKLYDGLSFLKGSWFLVCQIPFHGFPVYDRTGSICCKGIWGRSIRKRMRLRSYHTHLQWRRKRQKNAVYWASRASRAARKGNAFGHQTIKTDEVTSRDIPIRLSGRTTIGH